MKRFDIIIKRYAIVVWIIVVLGIVLLLPANRSETQTNVFCAYGKIFVEFEEGNHKWGTIFLNDNGKPIPCEDPVGTPVINRQRENII